MNFAAGFLRSQSYVTDAFRLRWISGTNVEDGSGAYETSVRVSLQPGYAPGQSPVVFVPGSSSLRAGGPGDGWFGRFQEGVMAAGLLGCLLFMGLHKSANDVLKEETFLWNLSKG